MPFINFSFDSKSLKWSHKFIGVSTIFLENLSSGVIWLGRVEDKFPVLKDNLGFELRGKGH